MSLKDVLHVVNTETLVLSCFLPSTVWRFDTLWFEIHGEKNWNSMLELSSSRCDRDSVISHGSVVFDRVIILENFQMISSLFQLNCYSEHFWFGFCPVVTVVNSRSLVVSTPSGHVQNKPNYFGQTVSHCGTRETTKRRIILSSKFTLLIECWVTTKQ